MENTGSRITVNKEYENGRVVNLLTLGSDGVLAVNPEFKSHQIASALVVGTHNYIQAELRTGLEQHNSILQQVLAEGNTRLAAIQQQAQYSLWGTAILSVLVLVSWISRLLNQK